MDTHRVPSGHGTHGIEVRGAALRPLFFSVLWNGFFAMHIALFHFNFRLPPTQLDYFYFSPDLTEPLLDILYHSARPILPATRRLEQRPHKMCGTTVMGVWTVN